MQQEIMQIHADVEIGSLNYGASRLQFHHPFCLKKGDQFMVVSVSPAFAHWEDKEDGGKEAIVDELEVALLVKRGGAKKFRKKFIYAIPVFEHGVLKDTMSDS